MATEELGPLNVLAREALAFVKADRALIAMRKKIGFSEDLYSANKGDLRRLEQEQQDAAIRLHVAASVFIP
jgi:hypothetical protein